MIAYKGTKNLWCRNLKYEPGKTYIFNGEIQLHGRGFHVCRDIVDVNIYYNLDDKDTVVLEIEIPDDAKVISSSNESKLVVNKLKVLRILTKKDIEEISNGRVKFDKHGNLIYIRYRGRYWMKREFDENGNMIYYEDSYGYWEKRKFDKNNNEVYYEDADGIRRKREYDENGNEIYYEDSYGHWIKRKFDENGNCIYYENSSGYWEKRQFDKDGNEIYYEDSEGSKYEIIIQD